jgi:hypothetical protein
VGAGGQADLIWGNRIADHRGGQLGCAQATDRLCVGELGGPDSDEKFPELAGFLQMWRVR